MKMKRLLLTILILSISIFPSKETKLKNLLQRYKTLQKISQLNKESGSVLNELYKIELNYKKAVSENNRISHLLSLTNSSIRTKEAEKRALEKDVKRSRESIKKSCQNIE